MVVPQRTALNLGSLVTRAASFWGGREAVVDADRSVSFRELDVRSNRFASVLRARGGQPGDRVALLTGNRLEWFDTTFGALKADLIRTYVNTRNTASEIRYQIEDSGSTIVVATRELEPVLR